MEGIGKTRAFLTEFIIVILFFSLSAVITLQMFLAASEKSGKSTEQTSVYLELQAMAEEIRGNGIKKELLSTGSTWENGYCYYREDFSVCNMDEAFYTVLVKEMASQEREAGITRKIQLVMLTADGKEAGNLGVCIYEPDWRAKQ